MTSAKAESCAKNDTPIAAAEYHEELYRILEKMLGHIGEARLQQIDNDKVEFLEFLDQGGVWYLDNSLFLTNSMFRIQQQIRKLHFPEEIYDYINFRGYIEEIAGNEYADKRRTIEEFLNRICFVMKTGMTSMIDPVAYAETYISDHFAENITLSKLAELTHFSGSYLSKQFNKTTGMTLRAYINKIRIENVIRGLKLTNKDVDEIAMDCGFRNMSHFYRVFKKQTGTTPVEIRRKRQKEEESEMK